MPIIFLCPHCRRKVKAEDKQAELTLKCPNPDCQKPVTIPKTVDEWVKDMMEFIDFTREAGVDNAGFHSVTAIISIMASDREDLFEKFLKVDISMMFHAATGGYLEAMKWLKKKGVRIDEPKREGEFKDCLPIHLATVGGHVNVVNWLLKQDTKLVHAKGEKGRTPIHYAAATGRVEVIRLMSSLITDENQWKAVINAQNDDGYLPIHSAAIRRQVESLKCLVELSADVDAKDKGREGLTPLHIAVLDNNTASIDCLVEELGADVNATNNQGVAPLFQAAWESSLAAWGNNQTLWESAWENRIAGMKYLYELCERLGKKLKMEIKGMTLRRFAVTGNLPRVIEWLDEKGIQ